MLKDSTLRDVINDPNVNFERLSDGSTAIQRVVDLVEVIESTWPGRVQVRKIVGHIKHDENRYCIVEVLPDGREYPIMWVKDDAEFTGAILERLIMMDNSHGNVMDQMQARNEAMRLLQKKKNDDQKAELNDIALHVIRSPLNKYVVNKDVTIRDYGSPYRK
jgi:hypothetical protein